jgi:hypothetical protein
MVKITCTILVRLVTSFTVEARYTWSAPVRLLDDHGLIQVLFELQRALTALHQLNRFGRVCLARLARLLSLQTEIQRARAYMEDQMAHLASCAPHSPSCAPSRRRPFALPFRHTLLCPIFFGYQHPWLQTGQTFRPWFQCVLNVCSATVEVKGGETHDSGPSSVLLLVLYTFYAAPITYS